LGGLKDVRKIYVAMTTPMSDTSFCFSLVLLLSKWTAKEEKFMLSIASANDD
jgi:hypothetical protein